MTDAQWTLIIGNKAYSSWSLRAWLGARRAGIAFREITVPLDRPDSADSLRRHSPSGRVPVLEHDGLVIWESLAILEYLAERAPEAGLWPAHPAARAVARAVAAEMHAGFAALRGELPMDLKRTPAATPAPPSAFSAAVQADTARIAALWRDCRQRFGEGGPFLFGRFGAADAMFVPVATRFRTYGVPLDSECLAYADALLTLPEVLEWQDAARAEPWAIEQHTL